MADRFKIGEGFVSVDTEDDTPKGLARIKAGVDRFIGDVEQKVRRGFASGFDSGADAAEARIAKFTREVTGELDRIEAKRTKINVDIMDAAAKIVKLRQEAETATVDRKLKIEAEIAATMAEMKVLKREAEDLDGKKVELEAKLRNGPETLFEIKALDKASNDWIKTTVGLATSVGRVTGTVAGLLSLLGPTTNGIIASVAATGQWLAGLSPLAALLPGLVLSFNVLEGTIKAVAPALGKAFSPVTDAAKELQKELGAAATKGVPELAASFVKANFPAIEAGTMRIADAINYVVTKVTAWTATAEGQRAVAQIMDASASAAERLAPSFAALVISIGNFIGRVGDPAIRGLADLFGDLMDKTNGWIDSLDAADISSAIDKAKDAASAFTDKLRAARDIIEWMANHKDAITGISDALAGIGIVLGLATGNWIAVVAGAITLILNHFDTFKQAASAAGQWFADVWATVSNDPSVKNIIGDLQEIAGVIREGVVQGLDLLRQGWEQLQPSLEEAWRVLGPIIHEFLSNKQVQDGIRVIAEGFVLMAGGVAALALAAAGVSAFLAGIADAILLWLVGGITEGVSTAFGAVTGFLGAIPGQVSAAWSALTTAVSDAWNGAVGFIESLPGRVSAAWGMIQQATSDMWGQILAYLSTLPGQIGAFFTQIATEAPAKIGEMAGQLVGQFIAMALGIVAALLSLPGQIGGVFSQAKDIAVQYATQLVSEAINWLAQLPGRAMAAITGLVGNVQSTFTSAKSQATSLADQLVSQAISFLAQLPSRAASAIIGLVANVTQTFGQARDAAVREATSLVSQAIAVIASLPGKAVAALAGIGSALFNAGKELVGGFIRGIQSALPDLQGALNSVTSKLPDWKGPAERDATILEPAGRLVMAGFGKGIAEGTRDLQRQLGGVTAAVAAIGSRGAASAPAPAAPSYNFAAGSIVIDASKLRTLQDLIDMLEGIRSTSRQYGAVARSA